MRAPTYVTSAGCRPTDCLIERDMLEHGAIAAIAFSSQAEVIARFRCCAAPQMATVHC